jgi:hypothetical protein
MSITGSAYLNDDASVIFENPNIAYKYATVDRNMCKNLGLAFKEKATFLSEGSVVLAEQYLSIWNAELNKKDQFAVEEILLPLKAVNASHARSYTVSMNINKVPACYIRMIIEYWGWCLYRNEHKRSSHLGGWFRATAAGVDVSLAHERDNDDVPDEECSAYLSYKLTQIQFWPWVKGKKYNYPKKIADYNEEFLKLNNVKKFCLQDLFQKNKRKRSNESVGFL